jgi:hypothetical protein
MSGDERVRRDYRAATDAVDERPSAATRAAILAAAAREVNSRPQSETKPRRPAVARWPMAAAAAVLLSTLAGLLAVRTEREMPSFTEAPQSAQPPVANSAAPPVADSATTLPRSEPAPAVPPVAREAARVEELQRAPTPPAASNRAARADAPPQPQRSVAAAKPAEAETARDERGRSNEAASGEASLEPRAKILKEESATATEAPSAGVRAAPEAFRTEPAPAVAPAPIAREKKDGVTTLSKTRQQAPAASNATGAIGGAALSKPASEADTTSVPRPEEWLEKIIRLRRNGQHVEADAELKQFRERYPQVQVPPEALGPSGTR